MSDQTPGTPENPTPPTAYQPPAAPTAPPAYPAAPPYTQPYGQPAAQQPYGQPGASQPYGQPAAQQPYGQPGYAPYGAYAPAKTNTLAIVSLIASLAGLIIIPLIGQIVGVITGHMALSQIKTTGEGGRGLALAGTIIGWASLALGILLVILTFALFLPLVAVSNTSFS